MPDIFLSYSRDDKATARRFAEAFEREGMSVWWDATLSPGEAYDKVTEKALEEAKAVVVLWSKKSVDSRWVRSEATQANANGTLVPVMIESCKRPIMFELTHTSDLTHWNGDPNDEEWKAYLAGVRRFVRKEAPGAAAATPPTRTTARGPMARTWTIAVVFAALLLAGAAWWLNRGSGSEPVAAGSPRTVPAGGVTLAVLPFEDYSAARDQEYFADGITEELTAALARIPDLKVVGRTSAFQYKGRADDLRKIGEELHARYLLEGSVRKADDRLRITAQLIEAQSGVHVWVETYERELTDVFAIQEEIATTIASALRVPLNVPGTRLVTNRNVDQAAYDDYLRARTLVRQRDFPAAVSLLEATVAKHPDYAPAWALMGYAQGYMRDQAPEGATRGSLLWRLAALDAGEKSARRAIELDPESAAGNFTLAFIQLWRDNWIESEELFRKALAIDPNQPDTLFEYMILKLRVGQVREAVAIGRRLLELEPFVPIYKTWTAFVLMEAGRPREAIPLLQSLPVDTETSGFYPQNVVAEAYAALGQYSESAAALRALRQTLIDLKLPVSPGELDVIEYAARRISNAPASGPEGPPLPNNLDFVYAYTGAPERYLPPRPDPTGRFFTGIDKWSSARAPFRKSPEFREVVLRSGIIEYWKRFGWADVCRPVGRDDFTCD